MKVCCSLAQFFRYYLEIGNMKNLITISLCLMVLVLGTSCKKSAMGKKVEEPFSSSKYESNNKYFRATGKGVSKKDNIAKGKADIEAKRILAAQVGTNVRSVADQYLQDTSNDAGSEVGDKFQSLAREVMNTSIADLRQIGQEKFYNGTEYSVFIAYEIRKNAMFRYLKKQSRVQGKLDNKEQKLLDDILDREIKRLEALDELSD